MNTTDEEHAAICEEIERTRDAYVPIFTKVRSKQAAIAEGRSRENPTLEELADLESKHKAWEAAKKRLDEFVKAHAR